MRSGLGLHTDFIGWGLAFVDIDNDGLQDLFMVNGHVYRSGDRLRFKQERNLYWNLADGHFAEISAVAGEGVAQHGGRLSATWTTTAGSRSSSTA